MQFELNNSLNWDLVVRATYVAPTNPAYPKGFMPIPTKVVVVDKYTLAIGAKSTKAKPTWSLGAYISPRLLFSPSSTSEFPAAVKSEQRQVIELNKLTLIQFTNFGVTPYLLEFSIPRWHQELSIEVWKYSGTTNNVKETLTRIEEKLDTQFGQ